MAQQKPEPVAKFKVGFLFISVFQLKFGISVQCLDFVHEGTST